jgi:DNA-binding response OmpR family regulator
MPTSSVAGFSLRAGAGGGAEAPLGDSQVPWQAAVGNRVRLVSFGRAGRRRSVAGFARSMGEVAIGSLAALAHYIRFLFAMSSTFFACDSPVPGYSPSLEPGRNPSRYCLPSSRYTCRGSRGPVVDQVGILIVDDDITSQRALKHILDSEGWRVRIVPLASQGLAELATGNWNLVIVNVGVAETRGPLFATLRELAHAEATPEGAATARKHIRVLFLVPLHLAKAVQPMLESEGLPYSAKPYHLHDFLEKVSELLVEAGAIAEPIRSIGGFGAGRRRRRDASSSRHARDGAMFASREDYQMTEEEMLEFERQDQEEQQRKKREKDKTPGLA